MNTKALLGSLALTTALMACTQRSPPERSPPSVPPPQARQQEATEAERKAASIETEMNKDPQSEHIPNAPAPGERSLPDTRRPDASGAAPPH